jgi:hypothetical protein
MDGLSFESVKYGYLYARCSGKPDVLDDLEKRLTRGKEPRLAGLAAALAIGIEKNKAKKSMRMEKVRKLEKSAR